MLVEKDVVTLEVRVDISGAMLDAEERIQEALNEAGMLATQEALKRCDTDGAAIVTGAIKWTSKDHGSAAGPGTESWPHLSRTLIHEITEAVGAIA